MWRIAFALAACSSPPSEPRPTADLSGVAAEFRPTTVAFSEVVGIAYQIPANKPFVTSSWRSCARPACVTRARTCCGPTWSRRAARSTSPGYHAKVAAYASAGATALPILCYGNPWANATARSETRRSRQRSLLSSPAAESAKTAATRSH